MLTVKTLLVFVVVLLSNLQIEAFAQLPSSKPFIETETEDVKEKQYTVETSDVIQPLSNELSSIQADQIIDSIKARLGHGGRYRNTRKASLSGLVESDHIPPKSIYKYIPNIKNVEVLDMASMTVPFDVHRNFPSTGSAAYSNAITNLNPSSSVEEVKAVMDQLKKNWETEMEKGMDDGLLQVRPEDEFTRECDGQLTYDYEEIRINNFDSIYSYDNNNKKFQTGERNADMKKYDAIRNSYAKLFTIETIYLFKTGKYKEAISKYFDEQKWFLKENDDHYSNGREAVVQTNKVNGVIDSASAEELIQIYKPNLAQTYSPDWEKVEEEIHNPRKRPC